jgi:hypothetical protein
MVGPDSLVPSGFIVNILHLNWPIISSYAASAVKAVSAIVI